MAGIPPPELLLAYLVFWCISRKAATMGGKSQLSPLKIKHEEEGGKIVKG
jgi:hypothetical protein